MLPALCDLLWCRDKSLHTDIEEWDWVWMLWVTVCKSQCCRLNRYRLCTVWWTLCNYNHLVCTRKILSQWRWFLWPGFRIDPVIPSLTHLYQSSPKNSTEPVSKLYKLEGRNGTFGWAIQFQIHMLLLKTVPLNFHWRKLTKAGQLKLILSVCSDGKHEF